MAAFISLPECEPNIRFYKRRNDAGKPGAAYVLSFAQPPSRWRLGLGKPAGYASRWRDSRGHRRPRLCGQQYAELRSAAQPRAAGPTQADGGVRKPMEGLTWAQAPSPVRPSASSATLRGRITFPSGAKNNKGGRADPLPPEKHLNYLLLFTALRSSAPAVNLATLRAAILITAPVWGLRPLRAFLCDTENVPKPTRATRSPLRRAPVTLSTSVSMAAA